VADRRDREELRARADAGDWEAAERLADLLVGRGTSTKPSSSCAAVRPSATGTPCGSKSC